MLRIFVFNDQKDLAESVAAAVLASAEKAVSSYGKFSILLAGGTTPGRLYERLAADPYLMKFPWSHAHLFWGDERYVPHDHPESNYRLVHETLLTKVSIPPAHIHPVPTHYSRPKEAAGDYETTLKKHFGVTPSRTFDVVLLGVGEDGHVASLFPGSTAVEETVRWVVAVTQAPKFPEKRITVTLPLVNRSPYIIILVSGSRKAPVVKTAVGEGGGENLPVRRVVSAQGKTVWCLDKEASAGLQFGLSIHPGGPLPPP